MKLFKAHHIIIKENDICLYFKRVEVLTFLEYISGFYVDKLWNMIYTKRVLSSCL